MTPEEIVGVITPVFKQLKVIIDKYPNAFSITYVEGFGHILNVDVNKIEPQNDSPANNIQS